MMMKKIKIIKTKTGRKIIENRQTGDRVFGVRQPPATANSDNFRIPATDDRIILATKENGLQTNYFCKITHVKAQ